MPIVKKFLLKPIGVREEKHQLQLSKIVYINSPIDWLFQVNKPSVVDYEVAEEDYREAANSYKF